MKKIFIPTVLSMLLLFTFLCQKSSARVGIENIVPKNTSIRQYELFELSLSLNIHESNPFFAEEVNLSLHVISPSGKKLSLPAFFDGAGSGWKARFTPVETGQYAYFLRLASPRKNYDSYTYNFDVSPSDKNGFIGQAKNKAYFEFSSGKPFFGIGHNVAWVKNNELSAFEEYFKLLAENGSNITRVWVNNPWTINIENRKFGNYNIMASAKLDSILELAEKYGIYVILVLDSYGSLMEATGVWGEASWDNNPYNAKKGGPCDTPEQFFTDKEAKMGYKNRLRYIIGRWSHSAHIAAFELWNEMDAPYEWLKEMASYIKEINPHGQFVTTSIGYPWGNVYDESKVWEQKNMEIVNEHIWGDKTEDIIGYLIDKIKVYREKYKKPVILGEFGMNSARNDNDHDPSGAGTALHNSIWASSLSGAATTALNWWWEDYIIPNNLHSHYLALSKFLKGVDWKSPDISYPDVSLLTKRLRVEDKKYGNIAVKPARNWGVTDFRAFLINNNGYISGGLVNYYLHGLSKTDMRVEPEFTVHYPENGKFSVLIDRVSEDARLDMYLDGKRIFSKPFPTGPGDGPWEKSQYMEKYGIYQCVYNSKHQIDIPKGQHVIRLSNSGSDWMGIKEIEFSGCLDKKYVNAAITGIKIGQDMLLWIVNKENNWRDTAGGKTPGLISNSFFMINGIKIGLYRLEWWDTYTGNVQAVGNVTATNNQALISVPSFSKDIAVKIREISFSRHQK